MKRAVIFLIDILSVLLVIAIIGGIASVVCLAIR